MVVGLYEFGFLRIRIYGCRVICNRIYEDSDLWLSDYLNSEYLPGRNQGCQIFLIHDTQTGINVPN
jgi:hypothetical protein